MDWTSFGRVRTAMTVRDYDIVMLAMKFDEGIEEPDHRQLRLDPQAAQPAGFSGDDHPRRGRQRARRHPHAAARRRRLSTQAAAHATAPAALHQADAARHREGSACAAPNAWRRRGGQAKAGKPETDKAAVSRPPPTKPCRHPRPAAHIATHTGESLARAAQLAVAANPAIAPTPVATPGRCQSRARRQGLALTPVPPPASPRRYRSASAAMPRPFALPEASASIPAVIKEPKPVAPENHQIPGYTILQKIGESEAAAVYLAISEDLGHNVALKISKRKILRRPQRHRATRHHVPARVRGHCRARSPLDHRPVRLRHPRGRRIPGDGIFPLRRPQGAAAESAHRGRKPSPSSRKSRARSRWCTKPASSIAT